MLKLKEIKSDIYVQENFKKIQDYINKNVFTLIPHRVHFKWDGTFKLPHQYNGLPSFFGITRQEGSGHLTVLEVTKDYIEVHVVLTDSNYIIEFLVGDLPEPVEVSVS